MSGPAIRFAVHGPRGGPPPASAPRAGRLELAHGLVHTPAFMPVGTQGTVKALTPRDLEEAGAEIVLANTYHLLLRPGPERVARLGGLHRFMGWSHPLLTDSGGYQVLSLADRVVLSDEGVRFRSHLDGDEIQLSPERALDVQLALGSDIMMLLDVCPALPAERQVVESAVERTQLWAVRSQQHLKQMGDGRPAAAFAIVQGGIDIDLRTAAAGRLIDLNFPGYALGGLMVGEPKEATFEIVGATASALPADRPRYLMGAGNPDDIVRAVALGIDLFDCVLPTRNARNGTVFTRRGKIVLKNAEWQEDERPIDPDCRCYACRSFSRAYLRHLFQAGEMLGPQLATLHSVSFYLELMAEMRQSIASADFERWSRDFLGQFEPDAGGPGEDVAAGAVAGPRRRNRGR